MSFVIAVYVPEGIVMASDSRQSVNIEGKNPEGKEFKVETVNSDAIIKTFLLEKPQVGISNFGLDLLGNTPIASHIKRFIEEELTVKNDTTTIPKELNECLGKSFPDKFIEEQLTTRADVTTIPQKMVEYFRRSFSNADAGFHIAGCRKEGKISIPYVYSCHVARNVVERRNIKPDGALAYGATWSGQGDILSSILIPVTVKDQKGSDKVIRSPAPVIWDAMALQDAIDFAIYAIRTTIDTMRFQARPKNVGGPIDVLVLTPEEAKWIRRKELRGSTS